MLEIIQILEGIPAQFVMGKHHEEKKQIKYSLAKHLG